MPDDFLGGLAQFWGNFALFAWARYYRCAAALCCGAERVTGDIMRSLVSYLLLLLVGPDVS